ncbi:hypothetical protein SteCoe_35513 [Stentor coeruleus]|uniref:ELMO domain-containing protein n=1 Tax=Stentor coeruleus TaxID=5963 RepID=A0A1R2AS46_9CILI|nr:hypothetical protein SteCoe_35513 [Stentor coeruleus]
MDPLSIRLQRSATFRRTGAFEYTIQRFSQENTEKHDYFQEERTIFALQKGPETPKSQKNPELSFKKSPRSSQISIENYKKPQTNLDNSILGISSRLSEIPVDFSGCLKGNFPKSSERIEKNSRDFDLERESLDQINPIFEENKDYKDSSINNGVINKHESSSKHEKSKKRTSLSFSEENLGQQSPSYRSHPISQRQYNGFNKSCDIVNSCLKQSDLSTDSYDLTEIVSNKDADELRATSQSLRYSILIRHNVKSISFEEALVDFYKKNFAFTGKILWIKTWYSRILSLCCKEEVLSDEVMEICEKFIVFSYMGFDGEDLFHKNLLETVYNLLSYHCEGKTLWSEIGFSSNDPLNDDLQHQCAASGLFLILFFDKYFPITLSEILEYTRKCEMAFVLLAFDLAEIVVTMLRKEHLNFMMINTGKCLEILFFLFAGCLICWCTQHLENPRLPSVLNLLLEKSINKNPHFLINLAKEELNKQY